MATITMPTDRIVTAQMKAERAADATRAAFEAAIQEHIDASARERGYRDGFALAGYVASTVPRWQNEAAAFMAWRDAVWLHAHDELDKVTAGQREQPAIADIVNELPSIAWPG